MAIKKKKEFNLYLRSRNFSCKPLKELIFPKRIIYRMGSETPTNEITKFPVALELNSPEACHISGNKILTKKRFIAGNIKTAEWFTLSEKDINGDKVKSYFEAWESPIIVKHVNSSKGKGIYLIKDINDLFNTKELNDALGTEEIKKYLFERYYTYTKEYRIHVNRDRCFFATRKMLRNEADVRWHRHAENAVFINPDNPLFEQPENWDEITTECINALKSIGLDFAAFDVKVSKKGKFIILESNSAPALGEKSLEAYKNELIRYINERL